MWFILLFCFSRLLAETSIASSMDTLWHHILDISFLFRRVRVLRNIYMPLYMIVLSVKKNKLMRTLGGNVESSSLSPFSYPCNRHMFERPTCNACFFFVPLVSFIGPSLIWREIRSSRVSLSVHVHDRVHDIMKKSISSRLRSLLTYSTNDLNASIKDCFVPLVISPPFFYGLFSSSLCF